MCTAGFLWALVLFVHLFGAINAAPVQEVVDNNVQSKVKHGPRACRVSPSCCCTKGKRRDEQGWVSLSISTWQIKIPESPAEFVMQLNVSLQRRRGERTVATRGVNWVLVKVPLLLKHRQLWGRYQFLSSAPFCFSSRPCFFPQSIRTTVYTSEVKHS